MSLVGNIAATWTGPRRIVRAILAGGVREDRALAMVMGAAVMLFVAQWPRLVREATQTGEELQMLMGASLFALVFVLPLVLYLLAGLARGLARLAGGRGTGFGARIALFWALIAAMPVALLSGLVAGLIGPGLPLDIVGVVWLAAFLTFWGAGLYESEWGQA